MVAYSVVSNDGKSCILYSILQQYVCGYGLELKIAFLSQTSKQICIEETVNKLIYWADVNEHSCQKKQRAV